MTQAIAAQVQTLRSQEPSQVPPVARTVRGPKPNVFQCIVDAFLKILPGSFGRGTVEHALLALNVYETPKEVIEDFANAEQQWREGGTGLPEPDQLLSALESLSGGLPFNQLQAAKRFLHLALLVTKAASADFGTAAAKAEDNSVSALWDKALKATRTLEQGIKALQDAENKQDIDTALLTIERNTGPWQEAYKALSEWAPQPD